MDFQSLSDSELANQLNLAKKSGEDMREKRIASIIFERFYKQIYSLARYYGMRHNDAEDVVQESFISLFKSIGHYQPERAFKPWFFKIVYNHVLRKYNQIKSKSHKDLDDYQELPDDQKENKFEKFHIREHLNDIIDKLPEKLKTVVVFWVFEELGYEEIGNTLGISSRQVRNRLEAAFELMKDLLEETT